jgi:hypothetical protein
VQSVARQPSIRSVLASTPLPVSAPLRCGGLEGHGCGRPLPLGDMMVAVEREDQGGFRLPSVEGPGAGGS